MRPPFSPDVSLACVLREIRIVLFPLLVFLRAFAHEKVFSRRPRLRVPRETGVPRRVGKSTWYPVDISESSDNLGLFEPIRKMDTVTKTQVYLEYPPALTFRRIRRNASM